MVVLPSFRLFNIPVTVRPTFLLIAVALGWLYQLDDWFLLIVWVFIVFISVLTHEFGHALVARGFGAAVDVELNGLGGVTRWSVSDQDLPPGKRALVAAAGSGFGFVLGGIAWLVWNFLGPFGDQNTVIAFRLLIFVNIWWGLLNWLPVRPLDGGHLVLSFLAKVAPKRADTVARAIFIVTAGVGLYFAFMLNLIFVAILAGWMLLAELGTGRSAPAEIPDFTYDSPPLSDPDTEEPPEPGSTELDWYRPDEWRDPDSDDTRH